jgi:hypothetical protein
MGPDETQEAQGMSSVPSVPPALLANIQHRLELREPYLDSHRSSDELVAALAHEQWDIRAAAVHTLAGHAHEVSLDIWRRILLDEHRLVRAAGVRALRFVQQEEALEWLLQACRDSDWEVREMAVMTLGEMGLSSYRLQLALLHLAQHDSHSTVREAANYALGQVQVEPAIPEVAQKEALLVCEVGTAYKTETMSQQMISGDNIQIRPDWLHMIDHYWQLLYRQPSMMYRSIWISFPLLLLLFLVLGSYSGLFMVFRGVYDVHTWFTVTRWRDCELVLAVVTTLASAAGTAFIYGGKHDPVFELTLSTPTSVRVVMLCRFALVVGYNMLLSTALSVAINMMIGGSLWQIMQLWIGPVLVLSSLTMVCSFAIGSGLSILVGVLVEVGQMITINTRTLQLYLDFNVAHLWQTNIFTVGAALMLFLFAVFYLSRHPSFSSL